jgi:TonB-linked SusC/RagA family outer membrane protein
MKKRNTGNYNENNLFPFDHQNENYQHMKMTVSTLNFNSIVCPARSFCAAALLCLMMLASGILHAQAQITVSGTVADTRGEPLVGVSIVVKGTTTGTITDLNGKFALPGVTVRNPVLQISYIGFTTQEVTAKAGVPVKIVLSESSKSLEEVVVVGYGSQRKKDLTGSVAVVKADDLNSLPVPSISDAMQGRAAGVQVISSGTPGTDATFRIRGTGTINNSDPLIVIDGLPIQSGLNQINMNDVESMQILKDASATAIYGSRGANGVVIITTKKGKEGKGHLDFNYSFGLQEAAHMIKMLDASQFAQLHNEMMSNAGLSLNPAYANPSTLTESTDWLDAMFRTAQMQNYSLAYSGSTEKSKYYISGNYLDQDGIVINTGYSRITLQVNAESNLLSNFKIGNNLTLNHDVKKSGSYNIQNAMLALPTQPIYRNGTYSGPVAQPMWDGDLVNPIGLAKTVDNSTDGYNVMGSVFGELEIIKNLKLKSALGLQANFWDSRTWAPKYKWDTSVSSNSYLYEQYNKNLTWVWDNTLTYDKTIGLHRIGAMLGTSAQENRYNYMNGSIQNFASDITQQLSNGTQQPTIGGNTSSYSLFSQMGRINYAYADTYLATVTLRRDGSSRFGENNKYGLFPSLSLAWRISQENFFKDIKFVNDLKIRGGYGVTGNQEIGNYSFASSLNTIKYNFNNTVVSAVVPTVMPNPNVQWERQRQGNIGFDASLFNQRVDITADAYIKSTDQMLVPMVVPVSTGYSDVYVPMINAGKMENKGIEVTVSSKNLTGQLKWNTTFNLSYNKNKVVSINDTVPMSSGSIGLNYNLALIQAGHPINEFYGFKTDGIFQNQQEVNNHALQVPGNDPYNRTSPGDIRFKDLNNDGVINDQDRTYLGSPNPTFIFAMNNTFSYRNFDLSLFMQGVAGNKICNANRFWSEAMDVAQNQTTETLKRWTGEGTSNTMPRAVYNDPNKNTRPSDRYIEDGSYLRIKNLTFGYTLPQSVLKNIRLSSFRCYVTIENLYTFTKYKGISPEVGTNGIDNNVYPVTRTYSIGVNLGL